VKLYIVLIRPEGHSELVPPPEELVIAAHIAGVYVSRGIARDVARAALEEIDGGEALIYHAQIFPTTENGGIVACERYE